MPLSDAHIRLAALAAVRASHASPCAASPNSPSSPALGLTWLARDRRATPSTAAAGAAAAAAVAAAAAAAAATTTPRPRSATRSGAPADKNLSLPQLRNAGPCPYVKVLYDAARYVELKDNQPSTGGGRLHRRDREPGVGLRVQVRPADQGAGAPAVRARPRPAGAEGSRKTYRYWVAVTDRNRGVLRQGIFRPAGDLPARPGPGRRRPRTSFGITIPRADIKVSGANFEVLIGFDVTPADGRLQPPR